MTKLTEFVLVTGMTGAGRSTAAKALEIFWSDDSFQKELAGKIEELHAGMEKIVEHVKGSYVKGRGFLTGISFPDPDTAASAAYGGSSSS